MSFIDIVGDLNFAFIESYTSLENPGFPVATFFELIETFEDIALGLVGFLPGLRLTILVNVLSLEED